MSDRPEEFYEERIAELEANNMSLENRWLIAMKQLEDLGCDNQWYMDQAKAALQEVNDE